MHQRLVRSPGGHRRLLRVAGCACLLSASLALLGACARESTVGPAPILPVIGESAPPPPTLGRIALADATAAAGPMASARAVAGSPTPAPLTDGTLDDRCASDADCAIKDVGSCCGYRPQCLNHDSPTDAAAVKARCASDGRVGICGFPAVAGCQCVQGHCAASLQTDEARVQ